MTVSKLSFPAAAFALCASMPAVQASVLSEVSTTGPQIDGPISMTNFAGFFGSGSVSSNTASTPVTDALATSITGLIAADNSFSTGAFAITDGGQEWLSGTLIDLAVASDPAGDDTITMLFDEIGGTAGGEFGDFVIAELTGEFGAEPFGATSPLVTSLGGVAGSATFTGAQIPLPAGFLLLLTAVASTVAAARWQKKA